MVAKLQKNALLLWQGLSTIKELNVIGETASPVIHLTLNNDSKRKKSDDELVRAISEALIRSGYGILYSKFTAPDVHAKISKVKPTLRICASADLTEAEIRKTIDHVRETSQMILN